MKILYYFWGEITKRDCVECMIRLGWQVDIYSAPMSNLTEDDTFKEGLSIKLKHNYNCIFSFDYYPIISEVANDVGTPYISWVYDSPHLTLQSKTLGNKFNRIYLFDYGMVCRYRSEGFDNVEYMPLACNIVRLEKLISDNVRGYDHEITFIGNLYNDGNNLYDQIRYLPDYIKGYLDAIISAQERLYGIDLAAETISDELCYEISKYVNAELGDAYRSSGNEILRGMIRKKVTVNERYNILKLLGELHKVDLYSQAQPPDEIRVNYRGYADYYNQMPQVFASSKINLNISLRSIMTGIPLRVIDILGAGGFILSNYQAEFSEYFANGSDIVWYESYDDLADKAAYYLEHDDEREQIALAGHNTATRLFSYESLLPKLFIGLE